MVTKQMTQDAHKVAFLVEQYPKHNLKQILALMHGNSPIDTNVAVWAAVEAGFIETDSPKNTIALKNKPDNFDFGDTVRELETRLEYAFRKVAENEGDFEETYLGNWTEGYTALDVLVAVRHLIAKGVFATYGAQDKEKDGTTNDYVFYTLAENEDKHWGLKQFKDPSKVTVVDVKTDEPIEELPDAPDETDESVDNSATE